MHPIGLELLGAEEVVSFDLFRQFKVKAALLALSQQVMSKKVYSRYISSARYAMTMSTINKTKLEPDKLDELGIKYLAPFDLHDYKTSNDFDLLVSDTVLEHVPPLDIKKLLLKSIDVLKVGGYFCHYIDLEDHKDPDNNPFEFLSVSEWTDSDSFSRGNRLRLDDWAEIYMSLKGIDFEFMRILERDSNLLPPGIKKDISNFSSGILVVGRRLQ